MGYYLLTSLCFVVAALVEFALVLFTKRNMDQTKKDGQEKVNDLRMQYGTNDCPCRHAIKVGTIDSVEGVLCERDNQIGQDCVQPIHQRSFLKNPLKCFKKYSLIAILDSAAFCLFIASYSFFNYHYWKTGIAV